MTLRMATVCSGIGAPEAAAAGLGIETVWQSEIEAFPAAVLAKRYPGVPNLGDMCGICGGRWRDGIDLLVGGTPCQAFSIAGLRGGLDDPRGKLTLKFVELCNALAPDFVLWENVRGVLSSRDNAFGHFLGALAGENGPLLPPGSWWPDAGCVVGPKRKLAWRVLDAQYFGLAQRRRRVFVVGCPRNGADPCEVLFERQGVQWHSPPLRPAGPGIAPGIVSCLGASGRGFARVGEPRGQDPLIVCGGGGVSVPVDLSPTLNACQSRSGRLDASSEAFVVMPEVAGTLDCDDHVSGRTRTFIPGPGLSVRRLTPTECERLMGFPDGYTAIPWSGRPAEECPDGPRYMALGNSMAVPVVRWIFERIIGAA